jgi:hypothetical protein
VSNNTIVMYGGSPFPSTPRVPDVNIPTPFTVTPIAVLAECPTCKRHIYGSLCPFCFAEQIAKAPGRAALEAVKKSLEEALRIVNEALEKG